MTQSHTQTPLSDLRPGDEGTVAGVTAEGAVRQRLMEMGFTRGAGVRVEKYAPMGDPMELSVKGYHISLRRAECRCILVDGGPPGAARGPAAAQQDGRGGQRAARQGAAPQQGPGAPRDGGAAE